MEITAQEFLQSEDAKTYHPRAYLFEHAQETGIPNIFRNPNCLFSTASGKKLIIDIFGPSGVGKDTVTRLPGIADIQIATSRTQRPGEPDAAYVWMDAPHEDETQEGYHKRLIKQYVLVSYAVENGVLYGVPRMGLDAVRDANIVTVRMSARSIDMLRGSLGNEYNIITIMVVPEDFESLIPSILQRGNVGRRLMEVVENMKLGKQYANYFLLNKHTTDSNTEIEKQIALSKKSFADFVDLQLTNAAQSHQATR